MRIFHLVYMLSFGDGVSNDARALNNILVEMGWRSQLYGGWASQSFLDEGIVDTIDHLPEVNSDDLLIYHYSIGWDIDPKIAQLPCKKIMVYHNITPPNFFKYYNEQAYILTVQGREHLAFLKNTFDYCLAVSEYNKQELIEIGYTCPIDVLPIIIPFQDYEKTPDPLICSRYTDSRTNILFTGRIAPNKKHENIIRAFSVYKKLYDPTARLFLVGDTKEELYCNSLKNYITELGVSDVVFSGHISFPEILAYYTISDLFLCMSEHEGFCIPLLEAMYFNLPVLTYAKTAVPSTMGDAGILLESNDPYLAAAAMNRVQTDLLFRKEILAKQQQRLEDFSYKKLSAQFKKYFTTFIEG